MPGLDEEGARARVIVTGRSALERRQTRRALRLAAPGSKVRGGGFTNVYVVEAPGDPLAVAERLTCECAAQIGHATAIITETASDLEHVQEAAAKVGLEHVGPGESFCFRLRKRGVHLLEAPTPELEVQIGGAIWLALQSRDGAPPRVDLEHPDVLVLAEVLGPVTAVGVSRKAWREAAEASARVEEA